MNNLQECICKYSLSVKKIQYYNAFILIYTEQQIYLFIEDDKNRISVFNQLKNFDYIYYQESINDENDLYGLYYFHENIDNFKLKDDKMIQLLALLHKKSLIDKTVSSSEILDLYESIKRKIQDVLEYYENLLDYVISFSFSRIDYYNYIINFSLIYHSIYQALYYLEQWYHEQKNDSFIRKAFLLHRTDIENFCNCEKPYFYQVGDCSYDLLIYDLVSFYKNNYDKIDMNKMYFEYQEVVQLLESEKSLFYCLISIPDKLSFQSSSYENTVLLTKQLYYIDQTNIFISKENKEDEKTDKYEF